MDRETQATTGLQEPATGSVRAVYAQDSAALNAALLQVRHPFALSNSTIHSNGNGQNGHGYHVPAFLLENLGDASFRADHRLRYAYLAGAMANGIGSADI